MKITPDPVKSHKFWNKLILILLAVLLVLASYMTILRDNFASGAKTYLFLKEARAYENIADLAKIEIRSNLPENIKNNFVKRAVVEKIMEIVITPENVSKVAEPGLIALYKLSDKAASLAGEKIVIDTAEFKKQANEYLPALGLPAGFTEATNDFVKAVPNQITIIDVDKNPNSPIAAFVKIREAYKGLNTATNVLWVLIITALAALVAINIRAGQKILSTITWSFGVAGGLMLAMSYAITPIVVSIIPQNPSPAINSATTNLVADALDYFLMVSRSYGWTMIVIALLALGSKLLLSNDSVKTALKGGYQKIVSTVKGTKPKTKSEPKRTPKSK